MGNKISKREHNFNKVMDYINSNHFSNCIEAPASILLTEDGENIARKVEAFCHNNKVKIKVENVCSGLEKITII